MASLSTATPALRGPEDRLEDMPDDKRYLARQLFRTLTAAMTPATAAAST